MPEKILSKHRPEANVCELSVYVREPLPHGESLRITLWRALPSA